MLDLACEYEKLSGILLRQWQQIKLWTVLKYDILEDREKYHHNAELWKHVLRQYLLLEENTTVIIPTIWIMFIKTVRNWCMF